MQHAFVADGGRVAHDEAGVFQGVEGDAVADAGVAPDHDRRPLVGADGRALPNPGAVAEAHVAHDAHHLPQLDVLPRAAAPIETGVNGVTGFGPTPSTAATPPLFVERRVAGGEGAVDRAAPRS